MRSAIIAVVVLLAGHGRAQVPCGKYDPAHGMLPSAQGWGENSMAPFSTDAAGGVLHQSTLPFTSVSCAGGSSEPQYLNWRVDGPFDFDDGAVLEAEVRILASQDGTNPCTDWPRPGFLLAMRDASQRNAYVGVLESKLILFNDPYLPVGHPGYSEIPFDTTDGFHTYRLEVTAAGMELWVDGVPLLSQGHGAPSGTGNLAVVGDGTTWANSEAQIRGMQFVAGSAVWCDRGFALTGSRGDPRFTGTGDLIPGSPVTLTLTDALENRLAFLIVGFSDLSAPFMGGILVPVPDVILPAIATDGSGQLVLAGSWPALPPGFPIFWHFVIDDPVGPRGLSFSNALLSFSQ